MRFKNSLTMKFMLGMAIIITVMMTINLLWSLKQFRSQAEGEMKEKASVIAKQFIATRLFIAVNQDSINSDASGHFEFKHLNPAAVGRGIGDIFNQSSGYKIKQTRLQVRNNENTPDNFEIEAMQQLAVNKELTEIWGYDSVDGIPVFRYLVPLYFDQSCTQCHGKPIGEMDISGHSKEGYSPGDFAGSISILFPMTAFEINQRENIVTQISFILFIVLISIGLIYLVMEHTVIMPIKELTQKAVKIGQGDLSAKLTDIQTYDEMDRLAKEFNGMAEKLQELYGQMEAKVTARTLLLQAANMRLQQQGGELRNMNARLQETDRLKTEFLAVMSHELRTPLTAIIAFAEILLSEGENLNELQREYLEDIFDSGQQLHGQINDILDMSKIEAGLIRLSCQEIDLKEVRANIMTMISPLLAKNKLEFTWRIHPNAALIFADLDKIQHVIRNLIDNAIKFTPQGGAITIDVTPTVMGESLKAIQIDIQDTGIGISTTEQQKVFDRFVQVGRADQREYSGSGLGLALAKHLVELHGGLISVISNIGQGSVFTVILPIRYREC